MISSADELSVVSLAFPVGIVVPAGEVLVIELEVFGDNTSVFRLGTTNITSTDDSWGHAPDCGFPIPITYTDAGFLNTWNIMNVVGDVLSGIRDHVLDYTSVYPNPIHDVLNVKISARTEVLTLNLYDYAGRDMGVKLVDGMVDATNLPRGAYMLFINTSAGISRQKIIKQ